MFFKTQKSFLIDMLWGAFFAILFYGEYLGFAKDIYGRDITAMHMQYYAYLSSSEGLGLLWNPYSHAGCPGLANIGLCMFYPINFLAPWFEPITMVRFYVAIHFFLWCAGLRLWLYSFGLSRKIVLLGLCLSLFSLSSRSLFEYGHLTIISAWAWTPWFLLVVQKLFEQCKDSYWTRLSLLKLWPLPVLSLIIAIVLIGAHPQMVLQLAVCGFLLCLFRHFLYCKTRILLFVTCYISAFILALGPAFFQLYETMTSIVHTGRHVSASNASFQTAGTVTPSIWIKSIFPFNWGVSGSYWGQFDFWFGQNYIGSCGLAGILLIPFAWRKKRIWPLLATVIILAILSMGAQTPLHDLYMAVVPGAKLFRLPFRHLYNAHLLMLPVILIVLQHLVRRRVFLWSFYVVVLIQTLYLFLNIFYSKILLSFYHNVLPAKVTLRLDHFGLMNSEILGYWLFFEVVAVAFIVLYIKAKNSALCVVFLLAAAVMLSLCLGLLPDSHVSPKKFKAEYETSPLERVAIANVNSNHNIHLSYGVKSAAGYDSLSLASYRQFLDTLVEQNWTKHTREQLYNLRTPGMETLGFAFIAKDSEALRLGPEAWEKVNTLGLYYLTRSFTWPGRLNSIYTDKILKKQRLLSDKLKAEGFQISINNKPKTKEYVKILSYSAERVELEVSNESDALLASSENHYPLWSAVVDGKPKNIKIWLGTFRSLALKPGKHHVVFKINRNPFYGRLIFSLLSVFLLIIYAFNSKKNKLNAT